MGASDLLKKIDNTWANSSSSHKRLAVQQIQHSRILKLLCFPLHVSQLQQCKQVHNLPKSPSDLLGLDIVGTWTDLTIESLPIVLVSTDGVLHPTDVSLFVSPLSIVLSCNTQLEIMFQKPPMTSSGCTLDS